MKNYNKLHKLWRRAHASGSPTKFVRNTVVFDLLAELNTGDTLDVGCGTGEYSVFLSQHGHRVTAFDPSSLAIQNFQKEAVLLDIKADVNTIEAYKGTKLFDNIISIEVMEHIESEIDFVEKLYSLLKKGGTLTLSVPATQFLYSEADRISGHYRRYSWKHLETILTDAGFKDLRIKRYGFPVLFFYSILRKLLIDKILIRYFSSSRSQSDNKLNYLSKCFPYVLKIDQFDKPLWSVGYVATCSK